MNRNYRLVSTLALGLLAMALAACGSEEADSSSDGASVDVAKYQAAAEEAMAPIEKWPGPTEGPAAESGKRVMFLSCGFAAEGCKRPADAAPGAAEALGWEVNVVDGKFDPQVYNRAIRQAIDQNLDAIILNAISSEAVAESLKQARNAGIVVGSWDSANEPSPDGVDFEVDAQPQAQGEAVANYLVWQTDGQADAYVLQAPEFKVVTAWVDAAKQVIERCDSCSIVAEDQMTAADASTRVPELVVASLRQHPEVNTFVAPYDAAMLAAVPSMEGAGVLDGVEVGSFNGITPWLEFIREDRVAATAGSPQEWATWAAFDNVNRMLAGEDPVEQNVPIRLITQDNIDDLPPGSPWEGDIDYQGEFERIWSGGS